MLLDVQNSAQKVQHSVARVLVSRLQVSIEYAGRMVDDCVMDAYGAPSPCLA